MANEWHYTKNGQRFGPVSGQQLKELAAKGQLGPNDLVWKEGMKQWLPASKVKGLLSGSAPTSAQVTSGVTTQPMKKASTQDDELRSGKAGPSGRTKALMIGGGALVGIVLLIGVGLLIAGRSKPQTQANGDAVNEQSETSSNHRSWELVKQASFPLKFRDSGQSLAYSPDGTHIAVLTAQQPGVILDATSLQKEKELGQNFGHSYSPITYSPKGNLLAWEGTKFVTLVDTSTYTPFIEIPSHESPTTPNLFFHTYPSFSPDGTLLLTASDSDETDPQEQVALWDLKQRNLVARIPGRHPACFLPDGKTIVVSAKKPPTIAMWDITSLKPIKAVTLSGTDPQWDRIKLMATSPDAKQLAVVTEASDHRIHLFSLPALEFKTSLVFAKKGRGFVRSIAFDKEGERLAAVGGIGVGAWKDDRSHGIAKMWHLPSMTVAQILGHQGIVGSVAFAPNGQLATLGRDALVRVWNERDDNKGPCVYVSSAIDEQRNDPTADDLANAQAQIVKGINDQIASGSVGGKKGKTSAYNAGYQEGLSLGNEYARRLQGMAPAAQNEFRNVYANELRTHERNRDEVIRAYGAESNNAQNKKGFCDGLRQALQKAGIL